MQQVNPVTFAAGLLERAGHLRGDPDRLGRMLDGADNAPPARMLTLWHGKPLCRADGPPALEFVAPDHPVCADAADPPLFLGLADGRAVFAADVSAWVPPAGVPARDSAAFLDQTCQPLPGSAGAFTELRAVMAGLSPLEAELAATARSMLSWHRSHRFCAACGVPSDLDQGGWLRSCPACGAQHFPRTDPVVIMLVTHGNAVLLGRSPGWPERMYSALAGFMEPGESIEAAVRREVAEETGVPVGAVRYLASQPWPWPSSLMIGCHAQALGRDLTLDPVEMADALWLGREDMMRVFAGRHPDIAAPREGAIAAHLLKNWLADRLE